MWTRTRLVFASGTARWVARFVGAFAQDLRAVTPTMVTTLHSFIDYMINAGCDSCVLHPSKLEQGIKALISKTHGATKGHSIA